MPDKVAEWRPVVDYEGLYEVSDDGRVRSLDRTVAMPNGGFRMRRGRAMKLVPNPQDGRLYIRLSKDGVAKTKKVHLLVAEAFIGSRPEWLECCHNNGDCRNNRVSNLRYDTQSSNQLDRVAHGTHHNTRKTECKWGHKFTPANTLIVTAKSGRQQRHCRICTRRIQAAYKKRKRAA